MTLTLTLTKKIWREVVAKEFTWTQQQTEDATNHTSSKCSKLIKDTAYRVSG